METLEPLFTNVTTAPQGKQVKKIYKISFEVLIYKQCW